MVKEKVFPFTWNGWDSIDVLFNSYYEVEFTEDFGVFKAGEKFSSVSVNYGEGWVEAYNEDGTEFIKKQEYKALAI